MSITDDKIKEIREVVKSGKGDQAYWLSCTPEERVFAIELMRQKKYSYDAETQPRIQRVFEVIDVSRYREHNSASNEAPKENS